MQRTMLKSKIHGARLTATELHYEGSVGIDRLLMEAADILPGEHPIVPIMLYDAVLAQQFAARLLDEGIYVIGFYFPVVPKGLARIRVQVSAVHDKLHLDQCVAAFKKVKTDLGV